MPQTIAFISRELLSPVKNHILFKYCLTIKKKYNRKMIFSTFVYFFPTGLNFCACRRGSIPCHTLLSVHVCDGWWDIPSRAQPVHTGWAGLLLLCVNADHLEKYLHWPAALLLCNSGELCFYSALPISGLWSELRSLCRHISDPTCSRAEATKSERTRLMELKWA